MTTSQRTSVCPQSVLERSAPYRPPTLTCDPITRSELFDRLDTGPPQPGARVVVLNAPAGSGKTVLLLDWIEQRVRARAPETAVAWLTITAAFDRDRSRWPVVTRALCEALGTPPPPPGVTFAAHLIEALGERDTPALLVVDDAHLITDSFVLVAVEYLIRHAPRTLTIVLSGRYEPPLRWHTLHVEGRLTRIRRWHLALTRSQAGQLFTRHGCTLTEPELDTVMELTEGWTALVRIAAQVVAGGARDRAASLALLARPAPAVVDFVVGEVLRPLPEPVLEFLIGTGVPERFTEQLADELSDTRTHDMLDELQRTGFPLTRHSEGGVLWFVHHPLVRAYLLTRARRRGDAALSELRLRTARALIEAGTPAAALPQLLTLPDPEPLRDFLRDNGIGIVFDGSGPRLFDALDRSGSAVADDPFVWRLRAIDAVTSGQDRAALAYLELIRAQPMTKPSLAPIHWLDALGSAVTIDAVLSSGAQVDDVDARIELPATGNLDIDCYLAVQAASAMLLHGRIERGEALLRSGITLAERTGRHRLVLRSLARLAVASVYTGAIGAARARSEVAIRYAFDHDLRDFPDTHRMLLVAALTRYVQGESFDAEPIADILEQWSEPERSGMPATGLPTVVACEFLLSRVAPDKYLAVHRVRAGLLRLLASDPLPAGNQGVQLPAVVRSLLQLREVRPAQELADRAQAVLGDSAEVILLQAMLADAAHKPRSARALLEPLLHGTEQLYSVTELSAWLRYAAVVHKLGMPAKAAEALESALRISEPDALISPWLDVPEAIGLLDIYAGRFGRLDDFAERLRHHPAAVRDAALPPLTASETTVLKHLPSGRTTGQIAADLGVSINTVKTHLRGIYSKLDANTRGNAVERARLVGLL
ncbi:LuxR C-terminal-related transcriptional regulator [Nocardia sp. NPDC056100]|uniref:LuxR C-terminal-related transcriptional regulator n=1 Tax=Nocardia sp. NPDC056100 TaxID=3345712 RepID=UPI0035DA7292